MSFGDNNNNKYRKDPTIGGGYDGRTPNESKYTDFPNNPDMYGHIDPYQVPNSRGGNHDAYPQYRGGPPLNNFAPPGQMPTGFDPNSPMHGVDGQGGLLMKGNGFQGPQRGQRFKGDEDIMASKGVIDPPPQIDPTFGGFGGDPGFTVPGMTPGGDHYPGMGGPRGMGGNRGMGGGRRGMGDPPGFGGGFGGPPGFGGGFM